jgi:hypothetical protein
MRNSAKATSTRRAQPLILKDDIFPSSKLGTSSFLFTEVTKNKSDHSVLDTRIAETASFQLQVDSWL